MMKTIYIICVATTLFLMVPSVSSAATCGTVQDVDGNTYNTVVVGTQCWMAENLKVGTRLANVATLPSNNGVIEKWCYSNDPAICSSDGGLYNWNEAMQYSTTPGARGICSSGWHIPTDSEHYTLLNYLKDPGQTCDANSSWWQCATAGTKLKSGGTSGMNFPLAGAMFASSFYYRLTNTFFWSSSQGTSNNSAAWYRYLGSSDARVARGFDTKDNGLSVRCVNDSTSTSINVSSSISASWTITGPTTLTGSGTSQNFTFKPSGTYTITWGAVSGYITPATQSFTLGSMGIIYFNGTYSAGPCILPWGGSINSGSSVTAYQASSVACGSTCSSQTRTCTTGSLSGTYTNQSCSVADCSPIAILSAFPSTIDKGQSSMLTWSSSNATSCTAAGGFSTGGATSGSASTGTSTPPGISNYQISCTGPGGSANSNTATVTVLQPQVSISANPTRVNIGSNSQISWTASQVATCIISGPGLLSTSLSGSSAVPIIGQSIFTITCLTNSVPIIKSIIVNVLQSFNEF